MNITQQELKELISYDPQSGIFTWKKRPLRWFKRDIDGLRWNGNYAGTKAGAEANLGKYKLTVITLLGKTEKAHRMAWLYMTGERPPKEIDHIDGDATNNAWSNLRDGEGINRKNLKMFSNNSSGFTGVDFFERTKRWRARANHINDLGEKKTKNLGYFDTRSEAVRAVITFRMANGYDPEHGIRR